MKALFKIISNKKFLLIAGLLSGIFLSIGGIVAALIPNKFFTRMTPVTWYEYLIWILTSVLLGAYIALYHYTKSTSRSCNYKASGGGIAGFLTFGCSICNKVLVFLLGVSGVLAYFEPIRPFLGIVGVTLLATAVTKKTREFTKNTVRRT